MMIARLTAAVLLALVAGAGCITPTGSQNPVQVVSTNYAGWSGSYVLRNAYVEATVVPAIGRVMRFNFLGEPSVLWENPLLLGKTPSSNPWEIPGSFGGDKTWPAPQEKWNWPPPPAFDSLPAEARLDGDAVVLTTPVDPKFGIRATRHVALNPYDPTLRIVTTYEKMQGDPVELSVWVISQFRDPVGVYFKPPAKSIFPEGINPQWGIPTNFVTSKNGLVRMNRNRAASHKVGTDAGELLWVGAEHMCLVEIGRVTGARYPDNGSSVEVYTNPDPAAYVELETLGPLQTLRVGDKVSSVNVYTLKRRNRMDPDADARPLLPH